MSNFIISILQQGLIYGIIGLGVYISYKILDFPDLSVDGSYTTGAAITAIMITNGYNPWLACLCALLGGCIAGFITGALHVYGKITNLLCGIITMTALFSINLAIMGRPNISIAGKENIFRGNFFGLQISSDPISRLVLIVITVILIKFILDWIFKSKMGMLIRATGSNPQLVTAIGGNIGTYKIIGLSISNGLVAFAGAMMCQLQNYSDIGMSQGVIVLGLTAVIVGMTISRLAKFISGSSAAIIGGIIYQAVIGTALMLNMPTTYLKLVTAILLVVVLLSSRLQRRATQ